MDLKSFELIKDKIKNDTSITIHAVELKDSFEENITYLKELQCTAEMIKVLAYWHMGRIIAGMYDHPAAKYGSMIIPRAAEALGLGKTTVRETMKFYQCYTDIEQACELAADPNIQWSHVKQLQRIKDPKKRKEVQNCILEEGMSVTKLARMVTRVKQSKGTNDLDKVDLFFEDMDNFSKTYFQALNKLHKQFTAHLDVMDTVLADVDVTAMSKRKLKRILVSFSTINNKFIKSDAMLETIRKDHTLIKNKYNTLLHKKTK